MFLLRLVELERSGIDAIAQIRRRRTVLKEMAQVGVAFATENFGAPHEQAVVRLGFDLVLSNRGPEARPAGVRIELGVGAEQLVAAAGTAVNSLIVAIPILPGKRRLGALLAANVILRRRQLLFPFRIGLDDLFFHGSFLVRGS